MPGAATGSLRAYRRPRGRRVTARPVHHNGGMTDDERDKRDEQELGAEGEGSEDVLPAAPSEDDDSALGDTDQHSSADA